MSDNDTISAEALANEVAALHKLLKKWSDANKELEAEVGRLRKNPNRAVTAPSESELVQAIIIAWRSLNIRLGDDGTQEGRARTAARAVLALSPKSPDTGGAPLVGKLPTEEEIKRAVFEAIDDCSTTDFYDISPSGLDNLAMLAAKAVIKLLSSGQSSPDRVWRTGVIPCTNPAGCNWPACPIECSGRP